MTIKEQIKVIIENEPTVKEIYENNDGCFKNIVMEGITNEDDDQLILIRMVIRLAMLSEMYDRLLDNIAQFGNTELIQKCQSDICTVFSE